MTKQEIMKLKTALEEETRISLLLAIHCAPILSGIKAANIMTVTGREFFRIGYLLQGTDISYRFLKTKGDKGILYLYRERELVMYLHSEEIRNFLKEYGYTSDKLDDMLERLSNRICFYSNGDAAFPHEIGIFLEYPLMDVKGFLENDGKNFIYSGYWKVYHDVQSTIQKFRQYDEERERAVMAVVSGRKIKDITV